jgi:hypothetical protein
MQAKAHSTRDRHISISWAKNEIVIGGMMDVRCIRVAPSNPRNYMGHAVNAVHNWLHENRRWCADLALHNKK